MQHFIYLKLFFPSENSISQSARSMWAARSAGTVGQVGTLGSGVWMRRASLGQAGKICQGGEWCLDLKLAFKVQAS